MSEFEDFIKKHFPSARLVGPSGDGCHVEIDEKWFAFGNIPVNAWKAAARKLKSAPNVEG